MVKSLLIFLSGVIVSYGAAKMGEHGMREHFWIEAYQHGAAVYEENVLAGTNHWTWSDVYFSTRKKYPPPIMLEDRL